MYPWFMPEGYTTKTKFPLPSFSFDLAGAVEPAKTSYTIPIIVTAVVVVGIIVSLVMILK